MAFTTGSVSKAHNTLITSDEIFGTGDGIETSFTHNITNAPVFLAGVVIKYTQGATQNTATSDSAGNFSGTGLTSGTVDEAGAISVVLSSPLDSGEDIFVDEYTAKGLSEKLRDFVATGSDVVQSIGTGDGIQTSFSDTLTNTTIADGQCRLRFTVQGTTYDVWESAGEFEHSLISSSSLDKVTGAISVVFLQPPDDTTDVGTRSIGGATGDGQDWMIMYTQNSQDNGLSDAYPGLLLEEFVLKNSGISEKDIFTVGIRDFQRTGDNLFGWNLNSYRDWDKDIEDAQNWNFNGTETSSTSYDLSHEMWSTLPTMVFSDDVLQYWFYSNKRRIIVVVRSQGTIYTNCYLGGMIRLASPSNYQFPLCVIGSSHGASIDVNSQSVVHTYIAEFSEGIGRNSCLLVGRNNAYQKSDDLKQSPSHDFNDTGALKLTTNSKIRPKPIFVIDTDIEPNEALGQLDGVFLCPAINLTSENTIDVGGTDFRIFQNVFRSDYNDFMCVKEE